MPRSLETAALVFGELVQNQAPRLKHVRMAAVRIRSTIRRAGDVVFILELLGEMITVVDDEFVREF